MDKKKAVVSIFILMLAFLAVGIVNVVMGKPSLLTAKLNEGKTQKITEIPSPNSNKEETQEEKFKTTPLQRIMFQGMVGDDVKRVQLVLKEKGYYQGDMSGVFDESLVEALKKFQKGSGLKETGKLGFSTIETLTGEKIENLYSEVKFTKDIYLNYKGEDVKKGQDLLKKLGYYDGEISGNFDELTKQAVALFQKDFNIKQTGNIGPQTQKVLEEFK